MTTSAPPKQTSIDASLLALFEERGALRVDPAVLQPAGLFLDLSGEDIRRRLFLTQDVDGTEFCLRPEYTIPVCRQHVAAGGRSGRAEYCYLGPVFRQRPGESGEFVQAGFEWIGREDTEVADSEALVLALAGVSLYGVGDLDITIGDLGLLEALFASLDVPQAMQRRLVRKLSAGHPIDEVLMPASRAGEGDYAGLLAAIEGQDPKAARAFVEDVISIAGITRVGGRSAGEIAERFLSRAANRNGEMSAEARDVLGSYLRLDGPADAVAGDLDELAREASPGFRSALDGYRRRLDRLAASGIEVGRLRFSAAFARSLDYYTGLIFEMRDPGRAEGRVLAAGGRYDRLLQSLGAPAAIPAVGCSFWLDRLGGDA